MNLLTKARLLLHIAHWRLTWDRKDLDYQDKSLRNPKFITSRQAARLIPDGATVVSSGMAGNTRCSNFFWAIREEFEKCGHPCDLTWITVGAQGSRGKVPGTLEELEYPGLITRYIGGHIETVKSLLKLADQGHLELHALPQGVETFLFEAQARGERTLRTPIGLNTFLDPRVGRGSPVLPGAKDNFVKAAGDELEYHLPPVDVALFLVPAADREGNLYIKNVNMFTEALESALAAHRNGGKVIASVAEIIDKDEREIFLPAEVVDHVVLNPLGEQTGSIPQKKYWPMFTVSGKVNTQDAVEKLKFVNTVLGITPYRGPAENALARLAASLFTHVVHPGAVVNIGVGLPEEVCRLVYEGGLSNDVTFLTETGVLGGLPTPGIFFGAAINPEQIMSSAQIFHYCMENLDLTCLGLLQADEEGNVNVSKRGEGAINYVGAGGFPDLVYAAKNIIFIGTWMAHGKIAIENGRLRIQKRGTPKFVKKVDEVTLHGPTALKLGKNIYYVTNVGVFQLTKRGLELIKVMPGIDIQKDILDFAPCRVHLPHDGRVPLVEDSIVTGRGFRLEWPS